MAIERLGSGILAVAVSLLLSGCGTIQIPLNYQPSALADPLQGAQQHKLFLDQVLDQTGGIQLVVVVRHAQFEPPLRQSLRDALRVELARLGFTIVDDRAQADIIAEAAATTAMITNVYNPDRSYLQLDFAMTLVFRDQQGRRLWAGDFKGFDKPMKLQEISKAYTEGMNAAIANAIEKIRSRLEGDDVIAKSFGAAPAGPAARAAEESARPVHSDVDDLPASPGAARKGYALVIGIERYRQKLPSADYAASDARLMARYLKSVLGFPEQNVIVLTNEQASKSDFEKYFQNWLPNHVEQGDEVVVYYSGHGAPNPTTGDAYLVPYDGDPAYLAATAYPLQKVYSQLAKLPAAKATVMLDSCFSGAGGRSVIAKGVRPLVTVVQGQVPPRVTVISASSSDQVSNTYSDKGHGLFTYYFLKALKERGADFRAAYDYLRPEVSRTALREFNAQQEPQWQDGR